MPLKKRTFRSYNPAFDHRDSAGDRKRSEVAELGTVTGDHNRLIFRAPSEVEIKQISLVVTVDVAANSSNYWSFQVVNSSKGSATLLSAAKTTQSNNIDDHVSFDLNPNQNLFLAPNDVLEIQIDENGSATNLQDCIVVVDWEVSGVTTTTSTSTTTTTTTSTSTTTSTTTTTTTTTSTTTTVT